MVLNRYGEMLLDKLTSTFIHRLEYIKSKMQETPGEAFLSFFCEKWSEYQSSLRMISGVLVYVDRQWSTDHGMKVVLFVAGIELFRLHVLESTNIKLRLFNELNEEIRKSRKYSTVIDYCSIKKLLSILLFCDPNLMLPKHKKEFLTKQYRNYNAENLECFQNFYKGDFEPQFIQSTEEFYINESVKAIEELSVVQYIELVRSKLFA